MYAQIKNVQQLDMALQLLSQGEPLLDAHPKEPAKFLCKKAKVLHLARRPAQTLEALEQAQSIAAEIDAKADSELAKLILETKEFLEEEP